MSVTQVKCSLIKKKKTCRDRPTPLQLDKLQTKNLQQFSTRLRKVEKNITMDLAFKTWIYINQYRIVRTVLFSRATSTTDKRETFSQPGCDRSMQQNI